MTGQLLVRKNVEGIHMLDKKLGFSPWAPKRWCKKPGQFVMKLPFINGKMRKDKDYNVSF